jgi:uncharacterized oligopeptide transporter (OPT) family protein
VVRVSPPAAATSQHLKTGSRRATPRRQQIGLVFGAVTSALLMGGMIHFLNGAKTTIVTRVFLAIALEILGLPSLPIAVDAYLPISTSAKMFVDRVLRWLIDRKLVPEEREGPRPTAGLGSSFVRAHHGAIMGSSAAPPLPFDGAFNMEEAMGLAPTRRSRWRRTRHDRRAAVPRGRRKRA